MSIQTALRQCNTLTEQETKVFNFVSEIHIADAWLMRKENGLTGKWQ